MLHGTPVSQLLIPTVVVVGAANKHALTLSHYDTPDNLWISSLLSARRYYKQRSLHVVRHNSRGILISFFGRVPLLMFPQLLAH